MGIIILIEIDVAMSRDVFADQLLRDGLGIDPRLLHLLRVQFDEMKELIRSLALFF